MIQIRGERVLCENRLDRERQRPKKATSKRRKSSREIGGIWREKIGAKIGGIRREEQEREQEKALVKSQISN